MKKIGRDSVDVTLIQRAQEAIARIDLSEGAVFLEDNFAVKNARGWVQHKFGIELDLDEVRTLERGPFVDLVCRKAQDFYDEKEAEYPVMAAIYRFSARTSSGPGRLDRFFPGVGR